MTEPPAVSFELGSVTPMPAFPGEALPSAASTDSATAEKRKAYSHHVRRRFLVPAPVAEPSRIETTACMAEIIDQIPARWRAALRLEVLRDQRVSAARLAAERLGADAPPSIEEERRCAAEGHASIIAALVQRFGRQPHYQLRWAGRF